MNRMKNLTDSAVRGTVFGMFAAVSIIGMVYAAGHSWSDPSGLRGKTAGNEISASHWNLLVENVENVNERLSGVENSSAGIPRGTVIAYNGTTCPNGWVAAAGAGVPVGTGGNSSLDLRGEFVRGLDGGRNVDSGRSLGTAQGDAIRNITGQFGNGFYGEIGSTNAIGAFVVRGSAGNTKYTSTGWSSNGPLVDFDASRSVPTASENRPRNVALLYCVKN